MANGTQGLFLDLDGTLADSLPALRRAYLAFLEGFGLTGSDEEFETLNGPSLPEIVGILEQRYGLEGGQDELLGRYLDQLGQAQADAPAAVGAKELLEVASARGWRVAVVTSTLRAPALAWLHRQRLSGAVDVVVAGDDVSRGKPAPDPYVKAIRLLDVDREASLAVEDGTQGATAAVAAGLPTFLLGRTGSTLPLSGPLFRGVLADLADVAVLL